MSKEQSSTEVDPAQERVIEDESRLTSTERLCDGFLDRYATMINHDNLANILAEQDHM